jgi:hypothetical protein
MAERKDNKYRYDVFLSHNSSDKSVVETIASQLEEAGLRPFLDKWHLVPGEPWQEGLEIALENSTTCVVFLGPNGLGPWENEEMRLALDRRVRDQGFRVIPVLLPGDNLKAPVTPPSFLSRLTYVDFRKGLADHETFRRLVAGIRGVPPGREIDNDSEKARTAKWVLVVSTTLSRIDRPIVEAIISHLREVSGDTRITLHEYALGSVVLVLESSLEVFERINSLYKTGQLTEVAGLKIKDLRRETEVETPKNEIPIIIWLTIKLASGNSEERNQAARQLGALKNDAARSILEQRWSQEDDPTVRYWLAIALSEIGGEEAIAAIHRVKTNESNKVALLGIDEALETAEQTD